MLEPGEEVQTSAPADSDLPHVASCIFGTPLLIARARLEVILGVLGPRLAGGKLERFEPETDPPPLTSITVERVAVISVIGHASQPLGLSRRRERLLSYGEIGEAIASALDIDSAGGEVGGLFDLVDRACGGMDSRRRSADTEAMWRNLEQQVGVSAAGEYSGRAT